MYWIWIGNEKSLKFKLHVCDLGSLCDVNSILNGQRDPRKHVIQNGIRKVEKKLININHISVLIIKILRQ